MEKKFAFMLMGPDYDPQQHRAEFKTGQGVTSVVTARNLEEAKSTAMRLYREGYGVIELCGAFSQEMARQLIQATEEQVGIGFVVHLPEQDGVFARFFGA